MKLAPAIVLGLLLVSATLAVVPTASATSCVDDPAGAFCKVVEVYECSRERPVSHKVIVACAV